MLLVLSCLSLAILPFKSVKVGDHFDMHIGYYITMHYTLENEANT